MSKNVKTFFCILFFLIPLFLNANGRDSLSFKGQLSAFSHVNGRNELPWLSGVRYIPQLNLYRNLTNDHLLDFEASANLYGNIASDPFRRTNFDGVIKPYRLWVRYTTNHLEIRAGLQKINFGSASLLRPLMWFDKVDPRDPLKLTDGVYGVLGRYYFRNNANVWLWGLIGNNEPKGWEMFSSSKNIPEFGGRLQLPVPNGETGFAYHHRVADVNVLEETVPVNGVPENRFGFDARFDMVVGWWVEASWSNYKERAEMFSNQETINAGFDYTFAVGNGLTMIYEQLISSFDRKAFQFDNTNVFSLLSFTYPMGLFDTASAIVYYDWSNNKAYNFITWQRQFNKFSLYLMGYVNPREYNIPAQTGGSMIYSGTGLQVMLVFNH